MIMSLKIKIEEDKRFEAILRSQLEEKEKMIGSFEEEIFSLRKIFIRNIHSRRTLEYWIK
jgi:hypothetical protein